MRVYYNAVTHGNNIKRLQREKCYLRFTPLRQTQLNLTIAAMTVTNQGYHRDPDVVRLVQDF